ncbi:TPA: hypothetical protein ACQZPM_005141 [Klebsiella pneumoniae]
MKGFKGTPGPWRLRNRLTSIDVDIPAEGPYDTITDIQDIHDARLIAAAPELLEALLDLEARACVYVNTSKAKDAIAKALGESK